VIPPGYTAQVSNLGTASPVYLGFGGGSLSTSNGYPVASGLAPVPLSVPFTAPAATVSVITSGGSATVGFTLGGPSGGTGP
jgi:hypothetical protein